MKHKKINEKIKKQLSDPKIILTLILLLALFLRLFFFVGMGFYDDFAYLEYASHIFKGDDWAPNEVFWSNRIAVYLPIVFFWEVFGINEISTSVYFIICSLGCVFVSYLLGKELFSEKIGLVSAFLLSFFPLDVIYATQIGPDIPFMLFSSLFILFSVRAKRRKSKIYAFFSGIFLVIGYLTKGYIFLIVPVLIFYLLIDKKTKKEYLSKDYLKIFSVFVIGFLLMFGLQNLYFYNSTGQWFHSMKGRVSAFKTGGNDNTDYMWYYQEMFNLESESFNMIGIPNFTGWVIKNLLTPPIMEDVNYENKIGFFEWIHDPPLFGFLYYFVTIGIIYFLYRFVRYRKEKDKYKIFLIVWILTMFLFFEYFLQFFCTEIMDYCVAARVPRFLICMNIPSMIIVSLLLFENPLRGKYKKIMGILIITFLLSTSVFYASKSHTFLRNGMGEVREVSNIIKERGIGDKKIYISDHWLIGKMSFYFKYNQTYRNRLTLYGCDNIDCDDEYYSSGDYIKNSYVITNGSPYVLLKSRKFPDFMNKTPDNWELLKRVNLKNYGVFNRYTTELYYAP